MLMLKESLLMPEKIMNAHSLVYRLVSCCRIRPTAAILPKKARRKCVVKFDAKNHSHCVPLFKFFEEQGRLGISFSLLMKCDVKDRFCIVHAEPNKNKHVVEVEGPEKSNCWMHAPCAQCPPPGVSKVQPF